MSSSDGRPSETVADVRMRIRPELCTQELNGVSQMSSSDGRPSETIEDVRMRIRPELCSQEVNAGSSPTPGDTVELSESSISEGTSQMGQTLSDDELFDQFKNHCASYPSLREKIIQWGTSRTPNRRVGTREISELAAGRIWVKVSPAQTNKRRFKNWQDILDEVKGAYQEVEEGVFMQPPSQPNEPGVQHRLRKSALGFWIIEEPNESHDLWYPRLQELPYGNWVDLKNSRSRFKIQVLKMENILFSLRDHWVDLEELERSMDFLFNSCNPTKLSTKLKERNLKHNIINLQLKLEKQYGLNFAIRVAETADVIALEGEDLYLDEK